MEFEKLQEIIAGVLSLDAASITAEKSFEDDLEADSLDRMEIIMQIEDEMGIEISDDALEKIITVGDAYEEIKKSVDA
ncbi:MAG: acyl carrier protein [Lachnospiraceae bacterium]|nr:acyl carrier protein [Lachnospiraceae bacterium]MCD8052591.1 acyl carrier protein [Lachnospiraceae bacterium]MCD8123564.1 acyl carrier protein [Lachnospiraceae bacterium]